MEHGERCGAQAIERGDAVEIADDRDDPVRAELRDFLATADESVQARAAREKRGNAERDVSTANQKYPDHKGLFTLCPQVRCTAKRAMREARNEGGQAARRGFATKRIGSFGSNPKGTGALARHSSLLSSLDPWSLLPILPKSGASIGAPCHPFALVDIV